MFIYPYKKGSKSAKALGQMLKCRVLTRPKFSRKGPLLNWGSCSIPLGTYPLLNEFASIEIASNKLSSFERFKQDGVACPDFTTDRNVAIGWIVNDGSTVICRKLLRSHSGKGIVIAKTIDELVKCPLYVKYFPKSYEFRVHVFDGKVIDYVQKRKRNDVGPDYNKYVRCHANGWVFCRDNILVKDSVKTLAVDAVNALGLDFGAVDICMTRSGKCKVLEVNTAPALENTTLKSYVKAIKEWSMNV